MTIKHPEESIPSSVKEVFLVIGDMYICFNIKENKYIIFKKGVKRIYQYNILTEEKDKVRLNVNNKEMIYSLIPNGNLLACPPEEKDKSSCGVLSPFTGDVESASAKNTTQKP